MKKSIFLLLPLLVLVACDETPSEEPPVEEPTSIKTVIDSFSSTNTFTVSTNGSVSLVDFSDAYDYELPFDSYQYFNDSTYLFIDYNNDNTEVRGGYYNHAEGVAAFGLDNSVVVDQGIFTSADYGVSRYQDLVYSPSDLISSDSYRVTDYELNIRFNQSTYEPANLVDYSNYQTILEMIRLGKYSNLVNEMRLYLEGSTLHVETTIFYSVSSINSSYPGYFSGKLDTTITTLESTSLTSIASSLASTEFTYNIDASTTEYNAFLDDYINNSYAASLSDSTGTTVDVWYSPDYFVIDMVGVSDGVTIRQVIGYTKYRDGLYYINQNGTQAGFLLDPNQFTQVYSSAEIDALETELGYSEEEVFETLLDAGCTSLLSQLGISQGYLRDYPFLNMPYAATMASQSGTTMYLYNDEYRVYGIYDYLNSYFVDTLFDTEIAFNSALVMISSNSTPLDISDDSLIVGTVANDGNAYGLSSFQFSSFGEDLEDLASLIY